MSTRHLQRPCERGYSLVEISLSVLILAVGLCSILAVFPVAISYGGKSMSSMTGSYAARSALSEIQFYLDDPYLLPTSGNLQSTTGRVGDGGPGTYYYQYVLDPVSGTDGLFESIIYIYHMDPSNPQFKKDKELLSVFWSYVYDK